MVAGFVGTYKLKELAFSIFVSQLINIIASLARMAFSIPIANFSDKHGFASGILLGTILSASAHLVLAFVFPATRWLFIVYICLFTISQAATYQNSFNIGYTILPQKYMVQAMAIKQTAQGLVAFVAAMGAGALVSLVQANSNRVFDIPM